MVFEHFDRESREMLPSLERALGRRCLLKA